MAAAESDDVAQSNPQPATDAPATTVESTTVILAKEHAAAEAKDEQPATSDSAMSEPTLAAKPAPPIAHKPTKPHIPKAQRLIEPTLVDTHVDTTPVATARLVAEPLVADALIAEAVAPSPATLSEQVPRRMSAPVHVVDRPTDDEAEVAPLSLLGTGLWHVRNGIIAGCTSAFVHFCVMLTLGLIVQDNARKSKPPAVEPLEVAVVPAPKKIDPPKVEAIVIKAVAQVPSTVASKGSGQGSDGQLGGIGGGNVGGLQLRPLTIGAVEKAPSGGSGFGTDKAFGESMMGEVGELKDASATFFGVKATGRSFVFVVDTSGSMSKNGRHLRCQTELLRSIGALKYGQKFFVVFFNSTTYSMPEHKLVDARPAQITKTQEWCLRAVPSGGTEPWDGLALALKMKPDAIYFLTDGDFDPAVVQRVDRAQPQTKKIPINTICFESLSGAPLMEAIAKLTNGTYLYVP